MKIRTPAAATAGITEPLRMLSVAELPTTSGTFRAIGFTPDENGNEHLALVRGPVRRAARVPVRIHSECLTGDVLGSLRCDCREQLQASLRALAAEPVGVLLYLRQEGRGIGLANKIRAYALQDRGYDTVDANHALGFGDDERDYRVGAEMLRALGVRSVRLMTNNPRKLEGLRRYGVTIAGRIPVITPPTRFNASYLLTKQSRAGHWLGLEPAPAAPSNAEIAREVIPGPDGAADISSTPEVPPEPRANRAAG
ncbi:MAG TPA: GTP cyclohydrolase II [Candidatus Acidoferrales bacterium]|nr:GTP cyclohydrolase II [Candidatus Acidoferrales bacterium]